MSSCLAVTEKLLVMALITSRLQWLPKVCVQDINLSVKCSESEPETQNIYLQIKS